MGCEYDTELAGMTDRELVEYVRLHWSTLNIQRAARGAEDLRLLYGFNCEHKPSGHDDPKCDVCRRYHVVVAQDRRLHAACKIIRDPIDQARELEAAFDPANWP